MPEMCCEKGRQPLLVKPARGVIVIVVFRGASSVKQWLVKTSAFFDGPPVIANKTERYHNSQVGVGACMAAFENKHVVLPPAGTY